MTSSNKTTKQHRFSFARFIRCFNAGFLFSGARAGIIAGAASKPELDLNKCFNLVIQDINRAYHKLQK